MIFNRGTITTQAGTDSWQPQAADNPFVSPDQPSNIPAFGVVTPGTLSADLLYGQQQNIISTEPQLGDLSGISTSPDQQSTGGFGDWIIGLAQSAGQLVSGGVQAGVNEGANISRALSESVGVAASTVGTSVSDNVASSIVGSAKSNPWIWAVGAVVVLYVGYKVLK